jgi:hypothetical protein
VAIGLGMTFFVDELAGERMERLVLGKAFRVQAHGRQELASISVEQQARSAEGWKTWMRSRTIAWESSFFWYDPRRTPRRAKRTRARCLSWSMVKTFVPTLLPPCIAAACNAAWLAAGVPRQRVRAACVASESTVVTASTYLAQV